MASSSDKPAGSDETRSCKQTFIVPKGVNKDTIKNAKNKQLRELSEQFKPKVDISTCNDLSEIRERLLCAYRQPYRQPESIADEINTLGNLMEQLKTMDHEMREELSRLFEKSERLLRDIAKQEPVIVQQLEMEHNTREYKDKINAFRVNLKQQECRVVVAGQVSAGKSTLLNLFLGGEVLPSHTLSCTATICELMYGERQRAEVVDKDGKARDIPFEDINKYVEKQEDRSQRFDHEMVRIYTPVEFLKSGITLVDTPGVGENKNMEEVLIDYVIKNDVFGFIFVMKCNDSGGVLKEFKEMLQKLSEIKDEQGQNKFDPKSVIFVANFWDKVEESKKPAVENRIKETLSGMQWMSKTDGTEQSFDLNRQLFFVNSCFALDTWRVGIISEQYESLIQGVKRFFPIGHKRKLRLAYMWLEILILRALHPVQTFKVARSSAQYFGNIRQKLRSVDHSMKQAKLAVENHCTKARRRLIEEVKKFLTGHRILMVRQHKEVQIKERAVSTYTAHMAHDEELDASLWGALHEWEHSNQHFKKTGQSMVSNMQYEYSIAYAKIEDVEKDLRSMAGDKTQLQQTDIMETVEQSMTYVDKVDFAKTLNTRTLSMHFRLLCDVTEYYSVPQPLWIGKFKMVKYFTPKVTVEKVMLGFVQSYESERMIEQLVDEHLQEAKKAIDDASTNLCSLIQSNHALMENIEKDMRKSTKLRDIFIPIADRLNDIQEGLARFMYWNIHEYEFPEGTLEETLPPAAEIESYSGRPLVTSLIKLRKLDDGVIVSLLRMCKDSAFKLRHLYNIATNIRSIDSESLTQYMAAFMGTGMYNNEPGLVFKGLMVPARKVMIAAPSCTATSRSLVINYCVKPFMLAVSSAVVFLHHQRLVHMELSVDSVYVQGMEPKLTNIFESTEVEFPSMEVRQEIEAGNYVYMAPETFPGPSRDLHEGKKYSSASDVYALGLMFMELWMQMDLYRDQKCQKLQTFMRLDPEEALFNCTCALSLSKLQLQDRPEELIRKCLKRNPNARPSATEFLKELEDFSAKTHQFV